ncbi:helix-turn-helix domain-containing protein [Streptomyces sp. H27-D2]|uniref:helix-turn-helix domain-containing protein n=1 Tax=Streptomyces sp. H27-D2 TaxID=3046304 RepID=UPI002DBC2A70|nr:helix-turn-helix transcriptional regulator [Streptomyces sp. H27-D2]MEC4018434.1 helix-turn-helix transcriptional regulator [Streptomyces sp. H27-D2]
MAHSHVSYGIWAAYGIQIQPGAIAAWELGEDSPTEAELTALAGALWCSPGDLLGEPTTLLEHRLARGIAPEDLARRIGLDLNVYLKIERTGQWTGNERQGVALAEVLSLPVSALIELTGRSEALAELLRSAVGTRWQAYVRPVSKMLPLSRPRIESALQRLHSDYQASMVSTLNWGGGGGGMGGSADSGAAGREFLVEILYRFWAEIGEHA